MTQPAMPNTTAGQSVFAPFRHRAFAVIWTATLVANIGTWMYSAASAWLMTTLTKDPSMVSLVQVAASLPMLLFALPAGALADIVDKRLFLIVAEICITVASALFALMIWLHLINPETLLLFTFIIECANAVSSPPWQSVVPTLVPPEDLPRAVAMNSVGVNVSRALGPAIGGVLTAAYGIAAPFWVNAASNLGTLGSLFWWHPPKVRTSGLPGERFLSAIRVGVRYDGSIAPSVWKIGRSNGLPAPGSVSANRAPESAPIPAIRA